MKKKRSFIPNLNTFSALVDRLIIENIKLVNFENRLIDVRKGRLKAEKKDLEVKCLVQKKIIALLKEELSGLLQRVITDGEYEALPEKRTFRNK